MTYDEMKQAFEELFSYTDLPTRRLHDAVNEAMEIADDYGRQQWEKGHDCPCKS